MKKIFILITTIFLFGLGLIAQNGLSQLPNNVSQEECGFDILHKRKMATDSVYRKNTEEFNKLLAKGIIGNKAGGTIYRVPVVVHVMHLGEAVGSGSNISEAAINQGIRQVNERWRKVAGSLGDGGGVDLEIEFALAVRDPSGNCTNGIVRFDMSGNANYAANGVEAATTAGITDAQLKLFSRWDPTQYYNIYLVSEIDNNDCGFGVQGYAYLAGSHGAAWDGMVQLGCKFAISGNTTLTHELGHAWNLSHTFEGDGGGGACPTGAGDFCADTPPHRRSGSDCDIGGVNACTGGSKDLYIHNYMDYSSDACQNEFTADQETRASAAMVGLRASFLDINGNVSLVPPVAAGVDFAASSTAVCAGTPISFYDESTCVPNTYQNGAWAGISFLWTFDDGINPVTTSTLQNPNLTLPAGSYSVNLSVTTGAGTSNLTKNGFVNVAAGSPSAACIPSTSNEGNFGQTVSFVEFNTLTNSSSAGTNVNHTDFTCTKATSVVIGNSYDLTVTVNSGGSGVEQFEVYIDYNNDATFTAGELVMSGSAPNGGTNTVTQSITIPATATVGSLLRMRVLGETGSAPSICGNNLAGDVEDYGVLVTAVLPVEFLSFDANAENNNKVLLDWKTATEINNDYFLLERSTDGKDWKAIERFNGAGNSNNIKSYGHVDAKPYYGISYYRLKQVDFDGEFSYSKMKAVHIRESIEVNVYPNPFHNNLNFDVYAEMDSEITIEVYNILGSLSKTKRLNLVEGNNSLKVDFSELIQGSYIVKLTNGNSFQEHFKITKN
jgi:hypothetical protein